MGSLIGDFIKEKRKKMGLSARELSRRSNVSQAYLSQIETGKNDNPSMEVLEKLAAAFHISLNEIISKGFIKVVATGYLDDINDVIYGAQPERKQTDILDILQNRETVFYNDKPIKNDDRQKVLDMLKILLAEYHK